jgi:hypothetical protein
VVHWWLDDRYDALAASCREHNKGHQGCQGKIECTPQRPVCKQIT